MLALDEKDDHQEFIYCMATVHAFAKASPTLLSETQLYTLLPYLGGSESVRRKLKIAKGEGPGLSNYSCMHRTTGLLDNMWCCCTVMFYLGSSTTTLNSPRWWKVNCLKCSRNALAMSSMMLSLASVPSWETYHTGIQYWSKCFALVLLSSSKALALYSLTFYVLCFFLSLTRNPWARQKPCCQVEFFT
jgi:hypothetical protein